MSSFREAHKNLYDAGQDLRKALNEEVVEPILMPIIRRLNAVIKWLRKERLNE